MNTMQKAIAVSTLLLEELRQAHVKSIYTDPSFSITLLGLLNRHAELDGKLKEAAALHEDAILKMKATLSDSMSLAAGNTNRVRALIEVAKLLPVEQFSRHAGQHPDTLDRDLSIAQAEFQRAKTNYETFCHDAGLPAYATYNED